MISVLYVDDEPELLELATIFLTKAGDIEIHSVPSAAEALALLETRVFDAVVTDYHMQEMDGIEFLKTVRASGNEIPFILFTGRGREEVVIRAIEHGADGYLQKGGDPRPQFTELAHKIRQVVRRKRAEDSLRESEERFRGMAERSSDLIITVDNGMQVTYVSPSLTTITGYDTNEIHGRPLSVLVSSDDIAKIEESVDRSTPWALPEILEVIIRKRDQSTAILELTGIPVIEEEKFCGIQIQAHDITARKLAEEKLKEAYEQITAAEEELQSQFDETVSIQKILTISEEKFRNVIEHSPLGVYFFEARDNEELILVGANPAADAILRISHQRLIGKTIEAAFPGLALTGVPERYYQIAMNGTQWHHEDIYRQGGAIQRALSIWGFQATPGTVIIMFMDVTDRRKAEEQIRDNDRFLQDIFSSIQDGISILDKDMTIVKVNHTMEKWYPHAMPLAGKKCYEAYHGRSSRCENCPSYLSLQTGKTEVNRIVKCGPDGENAGWFELYSFPLIDSQSGRMNGVIEYVRDITRQVGIEQELKRRVAVENLISGIPNRFINIGTSFSTEITRTLEEIGATFGFDRIWILLSSDDLAHITEVYSWRSPEVPEPFPDLEGMDLGSLRWAYPRLRAGKDIAFCSLDELPEEAATERKILENSGIRALAGISLIHGDHVFGFLCFASITKPHVWPEEELKVLRTLGALFTDVFAARRSQEMLAESEAKYRELVENAGSIIIRMDREANVTFFNEFAETFFGFAKEEILGRSLIETIVPKTETGGRDLDAMVKDLMKNPGAYTHNENENIRKNGERVWVSWMNKPVYDENGHYSGLLCIGTDINERKKAERALRQANQKLNLMNSITRHDINNKLTVVRGYIDLMSPHIADPKVSRYLEKEMEALLAMENQIAFTRIYQDLGVHGPEWQNAGETIQKAVSQIDLLPVTIRCDIAGLELYADPLLERVFYNLADNAVRHGRTIREIRVRSEEKEGALVIFWEDDGIGIPASEKATIFNRGYGKNTGLGLFLVREILSITGMTISETGVPANGARFEIVAPAGAFRRSHR